MTMKQTRTTQTRQYVVSISTEMMCLTIVLVVLAAVSVTSGQQYTSRWDNLDVDQILKNERLIKIYFRCLMDQGKCSPEATELKKNIPDALETGCSKCTEKQRSVVDKMLNHVFEDKQEMFKQLEAKYDPKGKYRVRYTEEAKKLGYEVTADGVRKIAVKN